VSNNTTTDFGNADWDKEIFNFTLFGQVALDLPQMDYKNRLNFNPGAIILILTTKPTSAIRKGVACVNGVLQHLRWRIFVWLKTWSRLYQCSLRFDHNEI
jgi:hypothetical protein